MIIESARKVQNVLRQFWYVKLKLRRSEILIETIRETKFELQRSDTNIFKPEICHFTQTKNILFILIYK